MDGLSYASCRDENLSAKGSHSLAEAMTKDARYCDNLYGAIDIYLKVWKFFIPSDHYII